MQWEWHSSLDAICWFFLVFFPLNLFRFRQRRETMLSLHPNKFASILKTMSLARIIQFKVILMIFHHIKSNRNTDYSFSNQLSIVHHNEYFQSFIASIGCHPFNCKWLKLLFAYSISSTIMAFFIYSKGSGTWPLWMCHSSTIMPIRYNSSTMCYNCSTMCNNATTLRYTSSTSHIHHTETKSLRQ